MPLTFAQSGQVSLAFVPCIVLSQDFYLYLPSIASKKNIIDFCGKKLSEVYRILEISESWLQDYVNNKYARTA